MNKNIMLSLLAGFSLILVGLACQATENILPTAAPVGPAPVLTGEQTYRISGKFTVTNDFVLKNYYYEHAVALTDLTGFVLRDEEWELPVESQVLGYMKVNEDFLSGTYEINLPLRPAGEMNDVDQDGLAESGVQIYAVSYAPNLYGGPFSVGDDRSRGWPGYLATIKTDSENDNEVIGGQLIIWAPDASQQFPSGFGEDGLLFTADDPQMDVPAGYSIINLDLTPFGITQQAQVELPLYEPSDIATKDFTDLSYTEAFKKTFNILRNEYAFSGIEGKSPDWDSLYSELQPRVAQAEKERNAQQFYEAMRDFTRAFRDGHVSISGDLMINDFRTNQIGGYGFTIRELDDGRVLINQVIAGSPAARAGLQVGAQVTEFNGKPINRAIDEVQPFFLQSSDFAIRYVQAVWLLRTEPGTQATVSYQNPNGKTTTVTLTAEAETDSLFNELGWNTPPYILPLESKIIEQNGQQIGYIQMLSNADDLNLTIRLFERALIAFENQDVSGVIIDMRNNSGGAPLGLAGFFTEEKILLGQLQYFNEISGQFENDGEALEFWANENQYHFNKMVLLVGQNCYSACELESYGFSQLNGIQVIGFTPTAGVEAETARGSFKLPAGIELTVPTGRFVNPDGSLFLEGTGVPLTIQIPMTEENLFSKEDVVLQRAIQEILK